MNEAPRRTHDTPDEPGIGLPGDGPPMGILLGALVSIGFLVLPTVAELGGWSAEPGLRIALYAFFGPFLALVVWSYRAHKRRLELLSREPPRRCRLRHAPRRGDGARQCTVRLETDGRAWEIGVHPVALDRFGIDATGRDACCWLEPERDAPFSVRLDGRWLRVERTATPVDASRGDDIASA